jgi:hypothetical protein
MAAKNVLQKHEPELNYVGEARVEVVDNFDGSQSINTYHPNSNVILESRTTDAKGNLKESIL